MSISKTIFQFGFTTLAVGSALLISGCAEPAAEKASDLQSTPQVQLTVPAKQVAVDKADAPHELVGVWMGSGRLNEASLVTAIEGLTPETRRQIEAAAASFLATDMAIEFKADGQMESAVEVTSLSGQRESGESIATWEAAPTITSGEYRVSSVEIQADGSKVSDYKTYRVSADGRQLVLLVDLPGLLGQCGPQIVFQRQNEAQSVASESGGTFR
jgi:hypothetical protein